MNFLAAFRAKSAVFRYVRCVLIVFAAFAVFLATAFIPSGAAKSSARQTRMSVPLAAQASTLATLAKLREAWVQDLHNKQLEPILKSYAPDAVFLQPNGDRIAGSAALRNLFQFIMATFNSDLTLHSVNLETSGDLAYDSGDFQENLTVIASGAKITSKGSYIIIYKRQPDGSWLIVQHVWTGTPPPGT
jgi:ketosteroid isomerase-like protein